jgi:cell division protein FtsW
MFLHYDSMRSKRIYAWLHPEETRLGVGLQPYQSMVALGSGGVAGRGLGESRQKRGFLFAHNTDFIFSIIGEELGLMATLGVLLGFAVLTACGFFIAYRAADTFGLLLGCGITCLIGIQAFINIGVVTNMLPTKGIPLPFISYGGSNLLFLLGAVGLLFSIARRARAPEPVVNNPFAAEALPSRQPA